LDLVATTAAATSVSMVNLPQALERAGASLERVMAAAGLRVGEAAGGVMGGLISIGEEAASPAAAAVKSKPAPPKGAPPSRMAAAAGAGAVGLCTLNQVDPYPITYSLSNP
jgi:hypothetical protein